MANSLTDKYRRVLHGLTFPDAKLEATKYDLDMALHDLNACLSCKGYCKTWINRTGYVDREDKVHTDYTNEVKMFVEVHKNDSKENKVPMFRIFPCPGVVERKEDIKRWVLGK